MTLSFPRPHRKSGLPDAWRCTCGALFLVLLLGVPGYAQGALAASSLSSQKAYAAYLKAFELAETGSRPAAFRLLAESLRLDPQARPASALCFRLLTEQRANTGIRLLGQAGIFTSALYSPDGATILTTGNDHTARLWDARTGAPLAQPMQQEEEIVAAVFSADSKRIATGTEGGEVTMWDAATAKQVGRSVTLPGAAWSISFSPDGTLLAAASDSGKVRTWNALTGKPLAQSIEYHEAAYHVSFSNDSKSILIPTGDDYTDVRDARTGVRRMKLAGANTILSARFNAAGDRIVTAGANSRAHVWDAATGEATGAVLQHGYAIVYADFSPDGRLILTASRDHTARVWDAETGRPVGAPLEHPAPVGRASFSPDSRLVATVAGDKAVRLWNAATGDPVALPLFFDAAAYVAFRPGAQSVLLAGSSLAMVVDLAPDEDAPAWLADLADFASTLNNYDHGETPDLQKIDALKVRLGQSQAKDRWTAFGQWFFTDNVHRTVSPWSQLTLEAYVDLLIARGDPPSLTYAQALSHPFPSWLARVSAAQARLHPGAH